MNDTNVPFYFKTSPGMDNNTDELELNGERVRLAQNCRFESEPGAVIKRPPLAYYNGTAMGTTGPMLGTYRFYGPTGARMIGVRDSGVYVGDDGSGVMSLIRTLTTTNRRMAFVTYNNLFIGSNGVDPNFVYDGSTDNITWELGACKAKVGSSTGITKTSISYKVEIVLTTGSYICGAVSNTIASVVNQSIDLSWIPLGPAGGTTSRKIFRKDNSTSGWRLVTTIADNIQTTYTDNTDDVSGGTQLGNVTDEMPKGSISLIHRERFFLSADPSSPNKIYYSRPYLPHMIQQTTELDYLEISKDDGDKITGLKVQQGTLACWKQNSIRKIFVAAATANADPTSWYVEDPLAHVGTPAQWSVCETPYGILFLGWDQWFIYDGSAPRPILFQFDCESILPSLYNDVFVYFNKGMFYAAYSDKEVAAQHNNRILCYDFALDKFSLDTIDANCLCAASGVDESGELYIGSSTSGFIFKAEQGENINRLSGKTQAGGGTKNTTFIGGSEALPTIEIGTTVAAALIPDDVCIFWADETRTPGSGWTEVAGIDGKFLMIDSVNPLGTLGGSSDHSHTVSGKLEISTAGTLLSGDGGTPAVLNQHEHTVTAAPVATTTALPCNVRLRIFKKNNTTVEYQFPIGAIVMWDQTDEPDGWLARKDWDNCYPMGALTGLLADLHPIHFHDFDFFSDAGGASRDADAAGNPQCSAVGHTHRIHGDTSGYETSSWQLNAVTFRFIQKVAEESSWDGAFKYCYALYHSTAALSGGWEDVSSTYTGRYIKAGEDVLSLVDKANFSHTHSMGTVLVELNTQKSGNGGYHNSALVPHNHVHTLTVSTDDLPDPPYYTFRLCRKILGQMSPYNDALTNAYTRGIYVSTASQINASSMGIMSFNVTKSTTDQINVYFRIGSTKAAVEDGVSVAVAGSTFTAAAHGLANGDTVSFAGSPVPDGISTNTIYYVVNQTTNTFEVSLLSGGSSIGTTTSGTTVTFKKWAYKLTTSGQAMSAPAGAWVQYLFEFIAADTTVSLPKLFTSDGYLFKFTYRRSGAIAESSVEFRYNTGNLNFDEPMLDKLYKKFISEHIGLQGSLTITWITENATGTFTFDLNRYPKRWASFFQSNAMGSTIALEFYKNDLHDLAIKEFKGLLAPLPMLI